jgi:uncharacterized membrane protein
MDTTLKVAELKASRGAAWIGESFRMFRGAPLPWMSMCMTWFAVTISPLFVRSEIVLVIANLLQPVFFASFAIAAYKQAAGERLTPGDVFSGFKRNLRALLALGAVLLLAQTAILFLMWFMDPAPVAPVPPVAPVEASVAPAERVVPPDYGELIRGKEWILLVGIMLTGLVKGALWFAPPLIAFHGMETLQAMRWSLYAAISNLGAMLVYAAALTGLTFLISVPLTLRLYVALLGLFVLFPVMAISTYIGYREVFEAQPVKPQ